MNKIVDHGLTIQETYYSSSKTVTLNIGQHVLINGLKGHIVKLGRKYIEVLIYPSFGGKRFKGIMPLADNRLVILNTHHE